MKKKFLPFIIIGAIAGSIPSVVYAEENTNEEIIEDVETQHIYICEINISCQKEVPIIENMCPTGETTFMESKYYFSFEKDTNVSDISDVTGETAFAIITKAIGSTDALTCSYDIEAKVDIDGNLTIINTSDHEPLEETIDVTIYTIEELEDELEEEELEVELDDELEDELEEEDLEVELDDELEDELEDDELEDKLDGLELENAEFEEHSLDGEYIEESENVVAEAEEYDEELEVENETESLPLEIETENNEKEPNSI